MVDYYSEKKALEGVISKVKPVTEKLFDIEVEIPGEKPMKMTWPSDTLFFCSDKIRDRECSKESKNPDEQELIDVGFCFSLKGKCE